MPRQNRSKTAVIDAGIIRPRPVMITVGATVLALFPLAMHGGPLWQPLCYAQIGGLTVATFIHAADGAGFLLHHGAGSESG